ncbi:unnamed protein product [Didymodactylos carnosus]|uniref:Dynamin N-terminal domain-containing protein n=1 Tax=Didymodactylos carnosus TaxID=1234261 RepID=A0A815PJR2_9BILA|nr:unnamed protein product [Didymodactylos carnosus]CAF1450191.1 unnamed protein product [Didymodactylos carnosus]CAF3860864.1 unnamed protein product [Didymodactylos carnosus]CAF4323750.1 unnamed protein product [Didymodactylos carnosus]
MPIIAPMKAGKSTIINGILGQKLLPTRNTAMTAIPTEIVFNIISTQESDGGSYLTLNKKFIDEIIRLQSSSHSYLQNHSDSLQMISSSYPHLFEVAQELHNVSASFRTLPEKTSGVKQICESLAFINDVIRLHENLPGNTNSGHEPFEL